MQKLYIIPGHEEKISDKNYQNLVNAIKPYYYIVPIDYSFNKRSGSFLSVIKKVKDQIIENPSEDVILGFSIGSLIAYQLSAQIKFKRVIICSISPILSEDLSLYPENEKEKIFTSAQLDELLKINYSKPLTPVDLFYGSLENPEVISRSQKLYENFGGTITCVLNCAHKLEGDYLEIVNKTLLSLTL